ncbi:MAG: rhomboid family intramembrane serine protease [Bifidobacterium sp.]|uniref:Rhomboid family intramembrane serine protease n=2 Tax=Bifidobacterium TaxID=1678 RepID=A0AB39UMJ5_9BIFI
MQNGFHGFSNFNNRSPLRTLVDPQAIKRSWRSGGPVITGSVIVLCVSVWLVETVFRFLFPGLFSLMMNGGIFAPVYSATQPWRYVTSLFMHSPNFLHVLFNMMALWSVGPMLERLMGHWQYLGLYLISGLGGSAGLVLWAVIQPSSGWFSAAYGASGAIFGLFGAVLAVFRRIGADIRPMLIWIGVNFLMPFVISGIAWQAHVGGFITGLALTELLTHGPALLRGKKFSVRMWIYGGFCVAVLVATIAACNTVNPLL